MDSALPVLVLTVILALAVWLLVLMYLAMQEPRLRVVRSVDRAPRVTLKGVALYLPTLPWLVVWQSVMIVIIAMASKRPADEVLLVATVVVGASRLLAHVNRVAADALAKTIPLAIVGLIAVSGQVVAIEDFDATWNDLDTLGDVWIQSAVTLMVLDLLWTALWFLSLRVKWRRKRRRRISARPTRLRTWFEGSRRQILKGAGTKA